MFLTSAEISCLLAILISDGVHCQLSVIQIFCSFFKCFGSIQQHASLNCISLFLQLLTPRQDIGKPAGVSKAKKRKDRDGKDKEKKDQAREKDGEADVDLINIDSYVAIDPITRLQQLKEEERVERDLMVNTRVENLNRIKEEVAHGSYCICRKGIDGLMIRCCLCFDWFHGSCVALPKAVNGKPISKSQTSFETMKELKYMCPLCARTRRPRLETILSLLVSLQKLPVRLPEGEALQFLIERVMQWQEKVKGVLKNARAQKLLQSVKLNQESNNGTAISSTQITFKRLENDAQNTDRGVFEKNLLKAERQLVTDGNVQDVDDSDGLLIVRPRKGLSLPESGFNVESKRSDESLSLECEEEMTESPKSAGSREEFKDGVMEVEDDKHATVVKQSRPQTPVDVCDLSEDTAVNMNDNLVAKAKGDLDEKFLDGIENLLMEGDLLEVAMDETQQLWMLLQSQRPLLPEDCKIMVLFAFNLSAQAGRSCLSSLVSHVGGLYKSPTKEE